ncbi:efflux RND transporter permease subunit [bacterium]|nr:efflux RND transporter permease subunit [bacterium]
MFLSRIGIRQPVFVGLVLLFVSIAGVASYVAMPRSLNPDVSYQVAMVSVVYPGASPAEVERYVLTPLEEGSRTGRSNT